METPNMYPKLLPLLKRFIFVRQGAFNRYYEGKLVSVDVDALQIQSYRKDGSPEELWTIALDTITEFSVGGRHLAELALKVSFLSSDEMNTNYDGEVLMLEGSATDVVFKPAADEVSE
jgi:hypothetical protein